MQRDFKGVWIPKEIYLNPSLSWTEKIMLIEIDSLDNNLGCFASNEHFAKFLNISKDHASKVINSLKKKGLIDIELIYKKDSKQIEKRIIRSYLSLQGYSDFEREGTVILNGRGTVKNNQDNNTISFTNTIINTKDKYNGHYTQIIDYLNHKTGSKYKSTSKNTQGLIKARLVEGFEVEDFKTVIDNKFNEWNKTEMEVYLRPQTLFGTKFESYLNQKTKGKKNEVNITIDEFGNKRDQFGLLLL